jgi:FkbM family methyltransferase
MKTADVSIIICTYNRHRLLGETLDSLAATRVGQGLAWEVIVVDNNSSDRTREVIEARMAGFPAPLRRVFESRQGKSHALNTGIQSSAAPIVAFTDDDVLIPPHWLEAGIRPLLERTDISYTGGPVRPLWDAPPPAWTDGDPGVLWGPIALVDYGTEEFVFEDRLRIPMGVNMAVRRSLLEAVGGFHPELERSGASLMGQGQAEFFFRTRAASARGLYVPRMELQHHVPAARMTRAYYRRWWFWKGVARARIEALHPVSELGVDLRMEPRIAGMPRFMWGTAARDTLGWFLAAVRRRGSQQAAHEMMLTYFAGYAWSRARRRKLTFPSAEVRAPATIRKRVTTGIQRWFDRLGYPIIARWRLDRLEESTHLQSLLRLLHIDCVLDVGANTGQYYEFLRLHVGYTGHVVSFEPVAEMYEQLQRSSEHDPRWSVHHLALGDAEGVATMNVMAERTLSSLLPRNEESLRSMGYQKYLHETETDRVEQVPVRRLDAVFDQVVPAGTSRVFLKSDTQGYDMNVVRGATGCLDRVAGMQIELPIREIYRGAPNYLASLAELTSLGYEITAFVPVQRDATLRVINVDCLMIRGVEAERLRRHRASELQVGRP